MIIECKVVAIVIRASKFSVFIWKCMGKESSRISMVVVNKNALPFEKSFILINCIIYVTYTYNCWTFLDFEQNLKKCLERVGGREGKKVEESLNQSFIIAHLTSRKTCSLIYTSFKFILNFNFILIHFHCCLCKYFH